MEGVIIHITWEYFLGIIGALIVGAWYTGARFSKLETSVDWVKEKLNELKISADNQNAPEQAFGASSPVNLKPTGERWLIEIGWKDYIEKHKEELMRMCQSVKDTNPYEVQQHIFRLFDRLNLEPEFEDTLEQFAFIHGTTIEIVRRVGAIHFRNLCLTDFHMNKEDIDKHDPAATT